MTKSTIPIKQLIKKAQEQIEFCRHTKITGEGRAHVNQCAALFEIALAAMDSESWCLPLDYLQGHKDSLEWAAQLAEANHPETGDWLYDDPIELAKAIRKGPDMPPAQPVADSEPVIVVGDDGGDALSYRRLIQSFEPGTKLYLHAQPAPVVSGWIPVSERLPEEGGRYWCYVEEQNSLGKSHYQWNCSWNEGAWSDKALTGRVTHWMPLPAAPQEVKSE
ncbi:DUF551 domain-containing protein [Klebsiella pneumoniae]|mgnify:FL=1|uniref:DUF551 domain-containing protein n=1 Tax=Klebsiella pneumoniae TaxID=573 RepID=UPI001FAD92BF|nr:DUF551 domain-containing protein [Klebsiella pneumoniae]MEC5472258.1 DUF551 domain-containing protein [Klebsiella pneumoniae]